MRRLRDIDETGREEDEGSEEGAQRETAREPRALLHVPVPVQQPRRIRRRHEQHRVLRGVGAGVGLLRCPIVRLTRRDRRHVREHLWRIFRRQSRMHRRTRRPRPRAPAVMAARREINADLISIVIVNIVIRHLARPPQPSPPQEVLRRRRLLLLLRRRQRLLQRRRLRRRPLPWRRGVRPPRRCPAAHPTGWGTCQGLGPPTVRRCLWQGVRVRDRDRDRVSVRVRVEVCHEA